MIDVACAIIIERGKILLTQNSENSSNPYKWEFPGGKVENGESYANAITREIQEELQIKINVIKALVPVSYNYPHLQIQLIPFVCELYPGKIMLTEHRDYRWVDLHEMATFDLASADREIIQVHENRRALEEYTREKMNNTR
jgi:8-oxo-dGTP diphosphatase